MILEKTVEIPAKQVIDSVFVQSEPDTVLIERVVEVPVYSTATEEIKEKPADIPVTLTGKSLADQEEIRNLLARLE